MNDMLQVVLTSPRAVLPVRALGSAGYDVCSAENTIIPACGKAVIPTDLRVVDQTYTGIVGVVLFNHAETDFEVKAGERVAQFICEKIALPEVVQVSALEETDRGTGGFGSTGTASLVIERKRQKTEPLS